MWGNAVRVCSCYKPRLRWSRKEGPRNPATVWPRRQSLWMVSTSLFFLTVLLPNHTSLITLFPFFLHLLRRKSILNIHWKDWCWSWNSNTLATWCKELTDWKRPWCWKRLKVGGQGDDRGWDVWMASPTQWTWVWVSSWSWWWTGKPGVLQSMGSQIVRHEWATELNWRDGSKNLYLER